MYSQIPPNSSYVFVYTGTQLPTKCNNGDLFRNALTYVWSKCGPINIWVDFNTSSGGSISGLTINTIPKATASTTIGNSSITDNGTTVSTTEPVQGQSFSTTGVGSGLYTLSGSTSGSAAIGVAAIAGTPSVLLLPITDPVAANYFLISASPGGGFMQSSWLASTGSGNAVLATSPTLTTPHVNVIQNTSGVTYINNDGTNLNLVPPSGGALNMPNGTHVDQFGNFFAGELFGSGTFILGTTFSASGCSVGTFVGGATAGHFTAGATGACVVTVTIGAGAVASNNGWSCGVSDATTPTALWSGFGSAGSTITIRSAAAITNDIIHFACTAY